MTGGRSRLVGVAVGTYRLAARVLPAEFRRAYGDELVACFEGLAEAARARGRLAVVGVAIRSLIDLGTRAPRQHLAAARAGVLGVGGAWTGATLEVRQGARRLVRSPSFTLAGVATLAVGIAATTSVFSLFHGVVLSPLPYPESDRVVVVDHRASGIGIDGGLGVTYGFFRFYRERARTASAMAMYSWTEQTLTGAGEPETLMGVRATPSLAEVLRSRPRLGRWFTAEEGAPESAPVVVLSEGLWRSRFGGDPGVLGRSVQLDGLAREVVGVMPGAFACPGADAAFWVPRAVPPTGIGGWNDMAVARLADGAGAEALERELAGLLPVLRVENDDPARVTSYLDEAGVAPRIAPLKEDVVGAIRPTLWVLLGTVGLVLLIAVANVTNLFLVRAEEGQGEAAVRTALGADRGRLARSYLTESLLLTGAACALGLAAAAVAVRVLRLSAPVNIPRLEAVTLSPAAVAVAVAVAVAAAVLLGLIQSLHGPRVLAAALKDGGRRVTAGRRRLRSRSVLVAGQVALALMLLVGSGLLFRTFQHLRAVDLGFDARQALTFQVALPPSRYESRAEAKAFHDQLRARLAGLPGVDAAVAVGECLPLTPNMCWGETLEAEGFPTEDGELPPVTGARIATPGYFSAMGIAVRGRELTEADAVGAGTVAVLSEAASAAYFKGADPLGRRIRFGGEDAPWHTVVGVASDVRARVATDDFTRTIYLPMLPEGDDGPPPLRLSYVLRTDGSPTALVPTVRRVVAELDPLVPLAEVRTLEAHIDRATAPAAFALALVGLAAVMALLLGAVGVYAVVSYSVSRRTAEIGLRVALGAEPGSVRALVLRQGGGAIGAGLALGLGGAVAASRLMRGMLFGVGPTDPISYLSVTALMAAIALLAMVLPATRATRVDPMTALRNE